MTEFESAAQVPPAGKSAFIDLGETAEEALGPEPFAAASANREPRTPLRRRREIRRLSNRELTVLRQAFASLYEQDQDRPDGYWRLCEIWSRRLWGTELEGDFLPWHRALLLHFEALLVEYDPSIDLPYWDWTDLEVPSAFREGSEENPLGAGPRPDGRPTVREPNQSSSEELREPVDATDFRDVDIQLHRRHSAARVLVGGDMAPGDINEPSTAPYDPLFWCLTANVDRLWAEWQAEELGK